MGEVWQAVMVGPHGFRRKVALKMLKDQPKSDEAGDALIVEARLGALLAHPNIAATHELGHQDGQWFVAMEWVDGPTLRSLTRSLGTLPPRAIVEIGVQAAAALEHVHTLRVDGEPAGLVHRDVKMTNLMVDRHGVVKLVDMGIARFTADETAVAAGTPGYMPPEQLTGDEDARADLFALGAVMYTLAAGERPFGVGSRAVLRLATLRKMLEDPRFLGPVDAAVPGLGAVVRLCLEPDPDARWESASALGLALRGILRAQPQSDSLAQLVAAAHGDALGPGSMPVDSDSVAVPRIRATVSEPSEDLVGRAEDLARLRARLAAGARLLCLHGPGGIGKTRLAMAAATPRTAGRDEAMWYVDLGAAHSVEEVCVAVESALNMPPLSKHSVRQLGYAMAACGNALFVFDHVEAVAPVLASTLATWMDAAPQASFLFASRVRLGLNEERFEVDSLTRDQGTRLFRARVGRDLTDAERAVLPTLVQQLEGIPLSIELAAARGRLLDVAQIQGRLTKRFQLLAGGPRDVPERHRSLRASLDASWAMLGAAERAALTQLTVFSDSWEVEAAEAVLDLSGIDASDGIPETLTALADHSMVRFDPLTRQFSMLDTVREYATAKED